MKNKKYRYWLALLVIAMVVMGAALPQGMIEAANAPPFEQGAGYEAGKYERDAVQPTTFNWNRQSRFAGSPHYDQIWSYATGDVIFSSPAIGPDGTVYIGSCDKKLYALDPTADKANRVKWSYATGDWIYSSPAIGADGTVYIGSFDKKLYALDPTANDANRLKWSFETGDLIRSSPAIGADGTIYIGSRDGKLYALDPAADNANRVKWSYATGDVIFSSPAIGSDGTVYIGSYDKKLYALDPTADDANRVKWSYETGSLIYSSPAIGSDGTIYIGSGDGKLYALDPTADDANRLKWSYATGGLIESPPTIGSDGTVYIGSFDKKLYAIGTNPPATPTSLQATAGDQKVTLNWDKVNEAHGYRLYQYEGENAPANAADWVLVNDDALITDMTCTIERLSAGERYWFAVQAVRAGGSPSDLSTPVTATPSTVVTQVASIAPIQVAKGTELTDIPWPTTVHVQLDNGTEADFAVAWDLANATYDAHQVGTYTITGTLALPDYIRNPQSLQAEIAVMVLPNTHAKLDGVSLNGETLSDFNSNIYTYNVKVSFATEQVSVTAATYDPAATYEVIGGSEQSLQIGPNQIDILVTAEDQTAQATYALHVDRQPDANAPAWPQGNVLTVSDITQTSMKLIWRAATDNDAVIGYRLYLNDGEKVDQASSQYEYSVTESVYTYTMTGLAPNTSYRFTVKAYDAAGNVSEPGLSQTATTLPLSSSGGGWYLSSNANLKTLEVSAGGNRVSLTPSFKADTLSYTAKTEAKQMEVEASAEHSAAKVTWQGQVLEGGIQIDLQEGENVIPLIVQAEDGSRTTYTLVIERIVADAEEPELPVISFTDIAGHWAESAIKRAAVKGIVKGYLDGSFNPNNPVTRAEFTVMLIGALQPNETGSALTFIDADQIRAWAKQAVARAVQAGIITGYVDGSFRPDAQITRVEMAVMIARALQLPTLSGVTTSFADDVDIPHWARGAVVAIRQHGMIEGRGGNRFVPNETATRAEATFMLLRKLEQQQQQP